MIKPAVNADSLVIDALPHPSNPSNSTWPLQILAINKIIVMFIISMISVCSTMIAIIINTDVFVKCDVHALNAPRNHQTKPSSECAHDYYILVRSVKIDNKKNYVK